MDDRTYQRLFSPGGCSCGKTFRSMTEEAHHRHNFPALCRQAKPTISVSRAIQLRQNGNSWPQVARILSEEVGRNPPFQARSIMKAIEVAGRSEEVRNVVRRP